MKPLPTFAVLCLAAASLVGPACKAPRPAEDLSHAREALDTGEYERAYALGQELMRNPHNAYRDTRARVEGAYVAGAAAWKLGMHEEALASLDIAMRSPASTLRGQAQATRGLVLADLGRHEEASRELLKAADQLLGEERAKAHFYAAVSQQKLGQWAQARTNLILARSESSDPSFQRQCDAQLSATGYTLQLGAFANDQNARRRAEELAPLGRRHGLGTPRVVRWQEPQGRILHVVQLGTFTTWQSARAARLAVDQEDAVVVPLAETQPGPH